VRELILIRHAETLQDPATPSTEWALTNRGVEQARAVGHDLEGAGIVAIRASSDRKAMTTALLIGAGLGLEPHPDRRLVEQHRPSWGFLETSRFDSSVRDVFNRPDESISGAETGRTALERFKLAIEDADRNSPEGPIAAVSHGTVMALFISRLTDEDAYSIWKAMQFAQVFCIEINSGEWAVHTE
jgi:broad specificity phosphatase PhoE